MKKWIIFVLLFVLVGCSKKDNTAIVDKVNQAIESNKTRNVMHIEDDEDTFNTIYFYQNETESKMIGIDCNRIQNQPYYLSFALTNDQGELEVYNYFSDDQDAFFAEKDCYSYPGYYDFDFSEYEIQYDQCYEEGSDAHIFAIKEIQYNDEDGETKERTLNYEFIFTIEEGIIKKCQVNGERTIVYSYDLPDYDEVYNKVTEASQKDMYEALKIMGLIDGEVEPYQMTKEIKKTGSLRLPENSQNQYQFDLELNDEKKIITGKCTIDTVANYNENYLVIRDYQASSEYTNVTSNLGNVKVERDQDPTIVYFKFDQAIQPEQSIHLSFDIQININESDGLYGYDESKHLYSLSYTFPILSKNEDGSFISHPLVDYGENAYSDISDYNIKVKVPEGFDVAGTGNKTKVNDTYQFSAKAVRDVAFMISDQFIVSKSQLGKTNIYSYAFDQATSENFLKQAELKLNAVTDRLGKYPYESLSVVQANMPEGAGGREFPQLIQIANANIYIEAIYHEIVHQYFYNIVGNDQYNEAWLDESLTTYLTRYFEDLAVNPKCIDQPYDYYDIEYNEYVDAMYSSGAKMFALLEEKYGKDKVDELITTYLHTYAYDNAHTKDMVYLMKEVLGEDCISVIYPFIHIDNLTPIF